MSPRDIRRYVVPFVCSAAFMLVVIGWYYDDLALALKFIAAMAVGLGIGFLLDQRSLARRRADGSQPPTP